MLSREHRLIRSRDFALAMRRGKHVGQDNLVCHYYQGNSSVPARIGFIVPKRFVPQAHARHLVKRRLRHLIQTRLFRLPQGSLTVWYAKSGSDQISFFQLSQQVDRALEIAQKKNDSPKKCAPNHQVATQ